MLKLLLDANTNHAARDSMIACGRRSREKSGYFRWGTP